MFSAIFCYLVVLTLYIFITFSGSCHSSQIRLLKCNRSCKPFFNRLVRKVVCNRFFICVLVHTKIIFHFFKYIWLRHAFFILVICYLLSRKLNCSCVLLILNNSSVKVLHSILNTTAAYAWCHEKFTLNLWASHYVTSYIYVTLPTSLRCTTRTHNNFNCPITKTVLAPVIVHLRTKGQVAQTIQIWPWKVRLTSFEVDTEHFLKVIYIHGRRYWRRYPSYLHRRVWPPEWPSPSRVWVRAVPLPGSFINVSATTTCEGRTSTPIEDNRVGVLPLK